MRGVLLFPEADRDFLQLIELRANNGAQPDVETVFILAGETYYVPTRLFAVDDPALYSDATAHSVHAKTRPMAQTVSRFFANQPGPKLIVRVHTHPNGELRPSAQDKQVGEARKRTFDRFFSDYEFFLGIHVLEEEGDPDPDWLRQPTQIADHAISWWGENRKHTLGVYNEHYEPRRVVMG